MKKRILLVEPGYKTKYPPLGLMKISTYHRKIKGDDVVFVKGCSNLVRDEYWDRVYISTLFTYNWNETIKTIKFYVDTLFHFSRRIYVGGILATLMPDDLCNATGIRPVVGLLNDPAKIEQDDDIIIDSLPPDYEILDKVNFEYDHKDAYIGYTTRGCIRKCDFCAVRRLEPHYSHYINVGQLIQSVNATYGEKQNLLLMDNNVLASKSFDRIIDDIKAAGFIKGATFGKTRRKRVVDFNQGLDARLLDKHKMQRLSEIPIEPMRIAFDHIRDKDIYVAAVRLAREYGQRSMSNYILYNHEDSPDDFYERLRINIDLNDEFECAGGHRTEIYSFPMRYIPLDAKSRDVNTGNKYWNKHYLRSIQVILSVIRGPVMPGKDFFEQAFGANIDEFLAILAMPEVFIRFRLKSNWKNIRDRHKRLMPYTRDWMDAYSELSREEQEELIGILTFKEHVAFANSCSHIESKKVLRMIKMHLDAENIVQRHKDD